MVLIEDADLSDCMSSSELTWSKLIWLAWSLLEIIEMDLLLWSVLVECKSSSELLWSALTWVLWSFNTTFGFEQLESISDLSNSLSSSILNGVKSSLEGLNIGRYLELEEGITLSKDNDLDWSIWNLINLAINSASSWYLLSQELSLSESEITS